MITSTPPVLDRGMVSIDGPGWAVSDYDGAVLPGRWESEEEATTNGLAGTYLLSGHDVTLVDA